MGVLTGGCMIGLAKAQGVPMTEKSAAMTLVPLFWSCLLYTSFQVSKSGQCHILPFAQDAEQQMFGADIAGAHLIRGLYGHCLLYTSRCV